MTVDQELIANHKRDFEKEGYLVIKGAIDPVMVRHYRHLISGFYNEGKVRCPPYVGDAGNPRDISVLNALSACDGVIPLIDNSRVFGIILTLMGPYIHVAGAEILIRFPSSSVLLPLHTDGGPSLRELLPNDNSKYLALKCQYFLSPCLFPDHANFCAVPGSHMRRFPNGALEVHAVLSQQVLVEAGDAVVFPWSLWHGVSRHIGTVPRESIIIKYAQRWAQPYDSVRLSGIGQRDYSTRRDQLLGYLQERPSVHVLSPYKWAGAEFLDTMYGDEFSALEEKSHYLRVIELGHELYGL